MALRVVVNGSPREFGELEDGAPLTRLVEAMGLKPDRVAIERNGEIVPRRSWAGATVGGGDKLEIVHFVGGGTAQVDPAKKIPLRKSW